MQAQSPLPPSPKWSSSTKLAIGLTIITLFLAALFYFRTLIGPILLAFILAFLFHPLASLLNRVTKLSWKMAVNLIYLVLLILLIALFTIAGIAIVQQAQSLVDFVNSFVNDLPAMVQDLSTRVYLVGPFTIDLSQYDLTSIARQLLDSIQPLLGQAGGLVRRFATSAATTLGWVLFILLVSYFLLSEAGQLRENLLRIEIPGYNADVQRLVKELGRIWDAFLRGQLVISFLVIVSYFLVLTILGTRLTIAISLMAGLARFIPYIGPLITWIVTAIVAFLQPSNYFGLEPFQYAALVLITCLVLDQIFDNLVVPRFLGQALGVHPAGVLIAALIAARLIGIVGLVLAAPALATINLLGRYIGRKMFDQEPWPEPQALARPKEGIGPRLLRRFRAYLRTLSK
jgi:predicted PurR-regulated permease PerM